jgi:hypothetical protein
VLVHIEHRMNIVTIEKAIEEQLDKELQAMRDNRKREPVNCSDVAKRPALHCAMVDP